MALQCHNQPRLSFSIANILGKGEDSTTTRYAESPLSSRAELAQNSEQPNILPWLNYSRYHPPKITRSRLTHNAQRRKTSGKPRVPFSTLQLMLLEQKYNQARYLSYGEVSELSSRLKLPEHRVKIWFQNRRAREKRNANTGSAGTSHGAPVGSRPIVRPSPSFCRPLPLSSGSSFDVPRSTGLPGAAGIFLSNAVEAGPPFAQRFHNPPLLRPPYFVRVGGCLQTLEPPTLV